MASDQIRKRKQLTGLFQALRILKLSMETYTDCELLRTVLFFLSLLRTFYLIHFYVSATGLRGKVEIKINKQEYKSHLLT